MPRFLDRTNKRYGRLIAKEHRGKDHRGKHLWLCSCDCGNKKIVTSDNLSSGKSKSCGCLKVEFLHKSGNQFGVYADRQDAMLRVQYSHLKRRHNTKNMTGEVISLLKFKELSKSSCSYCGTPYSRVIKDRHERMLGKKMSEEILEINGIDRVDSAYGYTIENSVPCCSQCNFSKRALSKEEFLEWVNKIYHHNFSRNGATKYRIENEGV
jgi:predicted small metal-binding protein